MHLKQLLFLNRFFLVVALWTSSAWSAQQFEETPVLIIKKIVFTDEMFGAPDVSVRQPSGLVAVAWRSGRFAIVRHDKYLGKEFFEGTVDSDALNKLMTNIKNDSKADRFSGGIEIHGDYYCIYFQYSEAASRQELGCESANHNNSSTEKLLSQIRSLPLKHLIKRSGLIREIQ